MYSKKCSSCGNENDPLLTNCLFCKSALPVIDINSISNEQLVMNAGQWIGKLKDGFYIVKAKESSEWTGNGIHQINKAQIQGFALQYLSLVQVRAISNNNLLTVYHDLKNHYEDGVASDDVQTKMQKRASKILLGIGIFMIILILILVFSIKSSHNSAN